MKGSTMKDFSFRKKQIPLKLAVMLSKTFRKKNNFLCNAGSSSNLHRSTCVIKNVRNVSFDF